MHETVIRRPLTDFFRELIRGAMRSQEVTTSEHAECYLVGLLEQFARPKPDWQQRPLAIDFLESFHADDSARRVGKLRQVGDTALFLSGIFMEHLERQLVSAEYYMSLGRSAYGHLASTPVGTSKPPAVFAEMAERFPDLVRVLTEVSFEQIFRSDRQTVRAYSRWLHTGSQRDARWLIRRGVLPVEPDRSGNLH